MNIAAVIMLCVMVCLVIFIDKHEVCNSRYAKLFSKEGSNVSEIEQKVRYIQDNIVNLSIDINKINSLDFEYLDENKYYLIKDKNKASDINITDYKYIVLSYIQYGQSTCVFDAKYTYTSDEGVPKLKKFIRKYLVLAMNYVQFFVKKDLKYAEVIFIKGDVLKKICKLTKKDIVFFGPSDIIIENEKNIKDITLDIAKSKYGFINFFVAGLSIVTGTVVISNLLYNIFSFVLNFGIFALKELIYAILIYYCYMGINNVIYKPIGKLKLVASVFFYLLCLTSLMLNLKRFKGDNMKNGISLIILIVTVAVLSIITVVTIQITDSGIESVELTKFYEDLDTMSEAVFSYYTSTGEMPIFLDEYNMNSIIALTEDSEALETQIRNNQDNAGIFYKIDVSLLSIDNLNIGTETTVSDIFVIDEDMENIYYVQGVEIGEQYYYCINQTKISDTTGDTSNNKGTSIDIVSTSTSIKLQKSTELDTSSIEVAITTTLNTGDTLQYTIGGITNTLSDGITMISIPSDITSSLSTTAITTFKTAFASNKIITVKKINNGQVIATSNLNLENLNLE